MCKETFSYHECCCRFVSSLLQSCGHAHSGDLTPEPDLSFLSEKCAECQETSSSERLSNQNQQIIAKRKSKASQHIAARWKKRQLALKGLNQYPHKREKKRARQDTHQDQHVQQLPYGPYGGSMSDYDELGSLEDTVSRRKQPGFSDMKTSEYEKTSDMLGGTIYNNGNTYHPITPIFDLYHDNHECSDTLSSPVDVSTSLSELFLDIPLFDIESYIRRSKELREQKWMNQRNLSKISRPMNAFLLYRKAVLERAKENAGVTGFQKVSKIIGASWKNESGWVRNLFNRYAKLENKYHEKAFSDYQFYSKTTQSTEASSGKRKRGNCEDQSDYDDDDSQYLGHNGTRKKKAKVRMEEPNSIEQNGSYSWQHTPNDNFKILKSEHDQPPYSADWRYSTFGEGHVQMPANHNLEFDTRDLQGNSQADVMISSATTNVEPSGDYQNLLLGSTAAMDQPGHFDGDTINPNLLNFDGHGNGFENIALGLSTYTQVEGNFAPSNSEYTQEGGLLLSLGQNYNWELNDHTAPISYSIFEEPSGQAKE